MAGWDGVRSSTVRHRVAPAGVGLLALILISVAERTGALDVRFWIDEALSVGIASESVTDIPGTLRLDGSPPLYYWLLHFWMEIFGDGERATHAFSLAVALAGIPLGYWAGRALGGRRAGWIVAGLWALNPFLTQYAQETRMYSLVAVLALGAAACFTLAYAHRRRSAILPFALLLAALIYTHNWGLFLAMGFVAALLPCWAWAEDEDRRQLVRDVVFGFGGAALIYLPWVPTLLFQSAHTGAPWALSPDLNDVSGSFRALAGGEGAAIGLLLVGVSGVSARWAAGTRWDADLETRQRRTAIVALLIITFASFAAGWTSSQIEPAWATRYLAVIVGPLLLVVGLGLASSGRLGVLALVVVASLWLGVEPTQKKSNASDVAARLDPLLSPGDLVISTQPEQLVALHYYLEDRDTLRYGTTLGPTDRPTVVDWRDGVEKLEAANAKDVLEPMLDALPVGARVALVRPVTTQSQYWVAPWSALVKSRSFEWKIALATDPRFAGGAVIGQRRRHPGRNPLWVHMYTKVSTHGHGVVG